MREREREREKEKGKEKEKAKKKKKKKEKEKEKEKQKEKENGSARGREGSIRNHPRLEPSEQNSGSRATHPQLELPVGRDEAFLQVLRGGRGP